MSHASKADKLLIKPAAGARPAPPRHADSSFPRHAHGGQSPDESHAARRQPGWQLPQTDQLGESYRPPMTGGTLWPARAAPSKVLVVGRGKLFLDEDE